MKRLPITYLLLPLFLFSGIKSFAQKKLNDFTLKISRPTEVFMTSDGKGSLACVFHSNKQFEVDFLDAQGIVTNSSVKDKLKDDKYHKIEGAVLTEKSYDVYFYNKRQKTISHLSSNRTNSESTYKKLFVLNPTDQLLTSFDMNGKFYVVIVPKHSQIINVAEFEGDKVRILNFNIPDMPNFYAQLAKTNDNLVKDVESDVWIQKVNYGMENTIPYAFSPKKLYYYDSKVVLTFDESDLTHLITLDLESLVADHKKLNFSLDKGNDSNHKSGNSFIYKNSLFRTTISPEQLNVSVIDLDSMVLLKSYNMFPEADIEIQNGPIIQEGGSNGVVEEKIIKKTEQYFKRVINSNISIAGFPVNDEKFQIQIGSYEIYTSVRGGSPGFGTPMISFGMGMGMGMGGYGMGGSPYGMGYPNSNYYNSSQNSITKRVVYFNSLLNSFDYQHIDGNATTSLNDKVEDYKINIFRYNTPELHKICSSGSKMLFGYYQKNGKRFSLIEFSH